MSASIDRQIELAEQIASKKAGRKVVTAFVYPPIPARCCDWQAKFDDDEPDDEGRMMFGQGATQQAAIDDLLEQAAEQGR